MMPVDRLDVQQSIKDMEMLLREIIYDYGVAIGKQELDNDFAHRILLETSKKLIMHMPCQALDDEELDGLESKYTVRINELLEEVEKSG